MDVDAGRPPAPVDWVAVLSRYRFTPGGGRRTYGFDLDGVVSPGGGSGCVERWADYWSVMGMRMGIDGNLARSSDWLPRILGSAEVSLTDIANETVLNGDLLTVLEISDVDDRYDDERIVVRVFEARVPGGGAPARTGGAVAFGLTLDAELVGEPIETSLRDGMIDVVLPVLPLSFGGGEAVVDMDLHDARLQAWFGEVINGGVPRTVIDGAAGGRIAISEVSARTPGGEDAAEQVRDLFAMLADLDPDPADSEACASVSAGFEFIATEVVLRR